MNENLIVNMTIATFKCLVIILPIFYCIGTSSLYLVTYLVRSSAPNYHLGVVTNEDILIGSLAFFSVVIYCLKIIYIFPSLNLIFAIALVFCLLACLLWLLTKRQFTLPLKNTNLLKINIIAVVFIIYLVRALIKARSLENVPYIPTRSNTDIFLYLKRISVFLSNTQLGDRNYNGVSALDNLYASPKLLSSFVYAIFTYISQDPGIAATILTSLILAAIVSKYISVFKQKNGLTSRLLYCTLLTILVFQPSLTYLQDQFYYSNLLYVYLLIYCLQDFFQEQKARSLSLLKFILVAVAITGFYPSQLPFLAASYCLCVFSLIFFEFSKNKYCLKVLIATSLIGILFFGQYTQAEETLTHFNVFDSEHGVNLVYMPIWSLLYLTPKPGAVPKDLGSFLLISASLILSLVFCEYLSRKNTIQNKYFRLFSFLYLAYSSAFFILPGSYRQGKFLLIYIIPLGIYCFLKAIDNHQRLVKNKVFVFFTFVIALYIFWSSSTKNYQNHLDSNYIKLVERISSQTQSIQVYNPENTASYTDIYLAERLPKIDFVFLNSCPSNNTKNWKETETTTFFISEKCPKNIFYLRSNRKIVYVNFKNDD